VLTFGRNRPDRKSIPPTINRTDFIMKLKVCPDYIGLCGSCRHASLAKTINGEFLARCDWFNGTVREPIAVCSKYDDRRMPSLHDMRQTAWILRTDDDKRVTGFVSNQQWRKSRSFQIDQYLGDDDD
jgi:hypothetical protein